MKTEKVNRVINKIVNQTTGTLSQRANLTLQPDTVEISKQKKPGFIKRVKRTFGPYITHLNKATVKELETIPTEKFWGKAQEVICDSYGIPQSLRAPIYIENLTDRANMIYMFDQNIVYVSPQIIQTSSRNKLFSLLKHEFTHQKQNLDMLRTEGLGEQVVEALTTRQIEHSMTVFKNTFRDMPEDEFEKLKPKLGENYEAIKRYRIAVSQGEESEQQVLDEIKANDYQVLKQQFENFRQLVIREMGVIAKDSNEAVNS